MPDKHSLEIIVNDPHSTAEERAIAARELGVGQFTVDTELPEALRMLATLGKKHIGEVSEDDWTNYFSKGHSLASEELIREWRFFVPPNDKILELLTGEDHIGGLRWHWESTLAICGERADVKAYALARLQELGAA